MQQHDWSQIPQEKVSETFSRKFVHGEKVMLAQLFLKKGCLIPEHSHESEQLSFIVSGALKFNVAGREAVLRSNQVLVIPSNVKHSAEVLEDTYGFDIFSPIRRDWIDGEDAYLRK